MYYSKVTAAGRRNVMSGAGVGKRGGCDSATKSCLTLSTPWTVAHQAPLSMRFPRQEYWSRLLFPPLGDLLNPKIEPPSPALAGRFFFFNC